MSRLDRLVSLLDTGYSSYIRNVAAEQIADVQKSRPEELFNLLGRVAPFLHSNKWDTRISTAKAIGLIAENTQWDPSTSLDPEILAAFEEIQQKSKTKKERNFNLSPNLLIFKDFDVVSVILKGTPLLGSAGREYDQAFQAMDNNQRLKMQKRSLSKKIGMDFLDDGIADDILDDDDDMIIKPEIKDEIKEESVEPVVVEEPPKGKGNARMRALAKRKARLGGSTAIPAKRTKTDESFSDSPKVKSDDNKVVVQHREESNFAETYVVDDPAKFPFDVLCYKLLLDMFEPNWEVRHGALLALRELVRVHGKRIGMVKGLSQQENLERNSRVLEDLACRLCCVLALDRFADYVADQAVAPVRESCAQTLGALIMDLPIDVATSLFQVLNTLIMDPKNTGVWAASHGGMLGLRYFVTTRLDLVVERSDLFNCLVKCVFKGLGNKGDDEVQAISAAVLLQVSQHFVEKQSRDDISKLIFIMWDCINDLKDELSTAAGNIMDLLANLCTYPRVLEIFLADSDGSLAHLVPRLYPFLRHSITDVRKATLRSLKTFLALKNASSDWIDVTLIRLLYQNILLEQNAVVVDLSMDLWSEVMQHFRSSGSFAVIFAEFWTPAYALLMTPIGTARKFYPMDSKYLINAYGEAYNSSERLDGNSSSKLEVNIDGPMFAGDTLVVDKSVFLRSKVNCSIALGEAIALATCETNQVYEQVFTEVIAYLQSPYSTQLIVNGLLLEEFGKNIGDDHVNLRTEVANMLNPTLNATMDNQQKRLLWRDINPILRSVRTQCQSLFSLLMTKGELPKNIFPKLPHAIEGDSASPDCDVFTLDTACDLANEVFEKLKSHLPTDVQVKMSEALDTGRRNLLSSIEEAENTFESRNISIRATAASAYVSLNGDNFPSKMNPIIRGLMDDIKLEVNPLLHERTSFVLSRLVQRLVLNDKLGVASKICKNLCGFLCVDVLEAPEFNPADQDQIFSLKREDSKLKSKDVTETMLRERELEASRIKREGALSTLSKILQIFKGEAFRALPVLQEQMFDTIVMGNGVADSEQRGQNLVDNISVLRQLMPYLDASLHHIITDAFPDILQTLFSKYSVVRHVAARCIASICLVMPTIGITFVIENILSGNISDYHNDHMRQGSIECIYHIMSAMGERILPYIIFFIAPVLGRMSDSNGDVRIIAATTFASIVKLVPLESGVSDPEDISPELLADKEKERQFIGQMMDPSKIEEFKLPVAINAELRKYQQDGVNWLAFLNKYNLHGVLCDDMGLGKTLQTICMVASDHVLRAEKFKESKSEDYRKLPSLIICPTTLTGHWVEEFQRYAPSLNVFALVGSPKVRQQLIKSGVCEKHDVIVVSYDTARNEASTLAEKYRWNYCVLDEGHIIKNAGSKLSRAVKMYSAYHRLILTGTPIQNNVLELWSLFDFLMPGFLGSEKSFNERFSKPIAARSSGKATQRDQEMATLALEALHKQVLPFTLRRLKEDVLNDLPPKIIQDYYCDLNDTQRSLYNKFTSLQKGEIEQDAKEALTDNSKPEADAARKHIFQALQYMRKLCNHPAFVQYTKDEIERHTPLDANLSPKLVALKQLLKDCGIGETESAAVGVPEAMSQHRALIFCQQRDMLDLVEKSLLREQLPSVSYLRMDGSTPGPSRQKMVTKFNDDPTIDVLLLTTHVGGLGLNLTGADTVIFVEHDWNPMNDLQAMDRAHRLGQKRVVNVYRLITRNTLEERIMGLQQFKMNIASSVINQQNKGLLSMETDQILDLFSSSANDINEEQETSADPQDNASIDSVAGAVAGPGSKATATLGELWDENEYAEEYNIDNFIKSLKK